ncbi:hypothetical protein BC332_30202 [Capsicum chinense]|nr:hypothetical protein BC332_30202 [Capsicum chinense]
MQSLCLVWFVHNDLWARDVNNNIPLGLIKLSKDLETFNSYPWGYENFKMIVKHLLTPLMPMTVNLYGFPWAFMMDVIVEAIIEQHNITVDNPSIASMEKEKAEPISSGEWKNYPFEGFNIADEAPKKTNKVDQRLFKMYCRWAVKASRRQRRSGPSFEIQKLAKISPTYLDTTYIEYSSDGLQLPNDGLDAGLLLKIYADFLWNTENRKLRNRMQATLKIHDDQSRIS